MAADRSRLAAALAYKQAEEERRRRMLESIPTPAGTTPAQPAPQADFRTNLENLSIGLGEGLTNQLEGIKGIVTDPLGTAKSVYEAGRAVVRDPSVIADALRQMGSKAMSGPLGAGEVIGEMLGPRKGGPMMQELDVYHGTPHRFPATEANPLGEFDASKIGTGEGAQAYGHGIYLAESPNVAKDYQKSFQQNIDQSYQTVINKRLDALLEEFGGDPEKAVNRFMQSVYDTPKAKEKMRRQLLEELMEGKKKASLYKADLPDEMIDRMLDWDKPIKDQPETVQNAMRQAFGEYAVKYAIGNEMDWKKFQSMFGFKNEADFSEKLRRAGIPGIKYLDAGSRGQGGSGTRNFVVFPGEEKKVRILERK